MTELDPADDRRLIHYLLGELAEEDAADLEEAYFADSELFLRLTQVESALVDDYVEGQLPTDKARQFEVVYLASESRRRRVEATRALARVCEAGNRQGYGTQRTGFVVLRAAVVMVAAAGAMWMGREALRDPPSRPSDRPRSAGASPSDLAPRRAASAPPLTVALVLLTGSVRGAPAPPRVRLTPEVGALQVETHLDGRSPDREGPHRAVLRSAAGREAWREEPVWLLRSEGGELARLTVPATALAPGKYVLTLERTRGPAPRELAYYRFDVEAP